MIQVRTGVFETNSSSTHSIAIPKSQPSSLPKHIWFNFGEFGWEFGEADPADYFYTAIYETSKTLDEAKKKVERLKDILDAHNIGYDFQRPEIDDRNSYFYLEGVYIDHGYELVNFVNDLLNDETKLLNFLSDGLVFTGNDNNGPEEQAFINREEEFIDTDDYDFKSNIWICHRIKNPYYMSDHDNYEWYYKNN